MGIEKMNFNGVDYAIVLRKDLHVEKTTFFTKPDNSMQLGIIKHKAGYVESPHIHKKPENLPSIQQVLFISKGMVTVDFFADDGKNFGTVTLTKGDTILLMSGGHAIRVVEDLECLTVKQGPYRSVEEDKIELIKEGKE